MELFLSIPPRPVSASSTPAAMPIPGLLNSCSTSLTSSPALNNPCPGIGFPIFCWIILWKSSGLLLAIISCSPTPGTGATPSGGGNGISTSVLISLLKSSSSSSSSLTNPIYSFWLKSLVPIIKGSFIPRLFFIKLSPIILLFMLIVSSSWLLFLFWDFCWSLKAMKSKLLWRILFILLKCSSLIFSSTGSWIFDSSSSTLTSSGSTICSINFVPLRVLRPFKELKKSTSIKCKFLFILLMLSDKSLHFCW